MITIISINIDKVSGFPDIVLIVYSLQIGGGRGVLKTNVEHRFFQQLSTFPVLVFHKASSTFFPFSEFSLLLHISVPKDTTFRLSLF